MKRKFTCTYHFIRLEKKIFKRAHQNPNANVRARLDVAFWVWYIIPPESQLAFHIYYLRYENILMCKRFSWDSGEWCFKNSFLFPIFILAPKLSRSFMEIGNQMRNHKIETYIWLIYLDGSI